jgi:hypothetical protein
MSRLRRTLHPAIAAAFVASILLNTGLAAASSGAPASAVTSASPANVGLDVGPKTYVWKAGFDACTRATASQTALSAWWNNSPFYVYGFYLGGVTGREQGCVNLTAANFVYGASIGWGFMPLWYGPQVPQSCGATVADTYIPLDPTAAYNAGVNEANAASQAALAIGLGANTTITYDLEAEGHANSQCRAAAQAFIKGWDHQLQYYTLFWGGLYGGVSAVYFTDFLPSAITYGPHEIWPWKGCCYTTVYGLTPQLSDSYWNQDQRYHQLWSTQVLSYGNVAAAVDQDCADASVASTNSQVPGPGTNNCNHYTTP